MGFTVRLGSRSAASHEIHGPKPVSYLRKVVQSCTLRSNSKFVQNHNNNNNTGLWINAAYVTDVAGTSPSSIWSGPGIMRDTASPTRTDAADLCALTTHRYVSVDPCPCLHVYIFKKNVD